MGLLFGSSSPERRAWTDPPPIPPNSEAGRGWGARSVNLSRTESSLQKVAVYAAVNLLREVPQMLPLKFYSEGGGRRREIAPPEWLLDPDGTGYGLPDFLGQVVYSDAMRGNVVAKISSRDNRYKPNQLLLQHPDDVTVTRDSTTGHASWHVRGAEVNREDIWHRRYFPIPGSIWGLSPVGAHALTVGLGIASEQFGAQFFLDGGHPTAVFQNTTQQLDPTMAATVKARIKAVLSGNREPLVLGSDWTYQAIQVTPNDSQFLETNNYSSSECARIFGPGMPAVLGYETGGSLTYANIEQFNQQLLTFTLDPWLVRLERMLYDLLPRPQYAKFTRAALLRTDLLTRFRAHEIALRNEFEVVNEVRDMEELDPVAWGDQPTQTKTPPPVPVQMEA